MSARDGDRGERRVEGSDAPLSPPRFSDRYDAGRQLARTVRGLVGDDVVVLALPSGGAPVAAALAGELRAPLDVLDVHEITAHRPDLGVGAVSADSEDVHEPAALALGMSHEELDAKVDEARRDVRSIIEHLRRDRPAEPLEGRTVVVVDDGLAVTAAAAAAAYAVKERGAQRAVLAVPVGVAAFVEALRDHFDAVLCLTEIDGRLDVRDWYADQLEVSPEDVVALVTGPLGSLPQDPGSR